MVIEDSWSGSKRKMSSPTKAPAETRERPKEAEPVKVHDEKEKKKESGLRERLRSPSLVEEDTGSGGSKGSIDIGGPFDAPATVYIEESNSILSSIVGTNVKLPIFRPETS